MAKDERRTDTASRIVAAQPRDVYRAFAEPDALMAWLPPAGMTGRALTYEFREGGRYRIELRYDEGEAGTQGKSTAHSDISTGRFVKLEPNVRIVQTGEFESDDPAFGGEMTLTWSFEPVPEGTRVTITASDVPHGIDKADHDAGLRSSLDQLARSLET